MKHVFLLFFILISLHISYQCGCKDDDDHFKPRQPATFCTAFDYLGLPVKKGFLDGYVHTPNFDSQGNINYILMTDPKHEYCNSHLWYAQYLDIRNGFVSEFTIDVSEHTCAKLISKTIKKCKFFNFGCTYYYEYAYNSCGAEGFAFVIQNSNSNATGLSGAGLGYERIKDALAVEFDFLHTKEKNDPISNDEYHISVIYNRGLATADEKYSLVNNYKPTNFKVPRDSKSILRSKIRIEYLNKNLRVFINNIPQLGYFYDLDFDKILNSNQFYLGLTASNSRSGSRINIIDWDLWLVTSNAAKSYNALVPSKSKNNVFQISEKVVIRVYLRSGCDSKYWPTDDADKIENLSYENRFAESCNLKEKIFTYNSDYSAEMTFICSKAGSQRLIVLYQGKIIGKPVPVVMVSNDMIYAKLDFFQGTVGNIDEPFKFRFIPYDPYGNIPDIDVNTVRANLKIEWPQAVDTRNDYLITKEATGNFLVTLTTDKIGEYSIANIRLFIRFVHNGLYHFSIEPGAVDLKNSFARLLDPAKFDIIKGTVTVGTKLMLMVYLKDKANNAIPTSKIPDSYVKSILKTNTAQTLLSKPIKNFVFYSYNFVLEKAGTATIVVNYIDKPITCQYCQITILPAESVFENSELYEYSNKTNDFLERDQDAFTVNKGDNFLFLFVLKDKYNNKVPVSSAKDYKAQLYGNNMDIINLELTIYKQGLKLEVPKAQDDYYKNLVGLENYTINVAEIKSKKEKKWRLNIISDKTDNGAGNGDYVPANTIWFWLNPLLQKKYAVAGETYRVAVQLMTNESKRYNGYIDESLININFKTLLTNLGEVISGPRKTAITGTYTYTFSLRKGKFEERTLGFTIKNVILSKKETFLDAPTAAYKAGIGSSSLENSETLITGEISKPYTFVLEVFDKYNNPQNYRGTQAIISLKSIDKKTTVVPKCSSSNLGTYSCVVTMDSAGNYTIESTFFKNNKVSIYYVYFKTGKPSIITSTASITDDLSKGKVAGSEVNFRIVVKDDAGERIGKADILKFLDSFSLALQEPNKQALTNVPLVSVNDKGEILTSAQLNNAGKNVFFPTFESQKISCAICSVDIKANDINTATVYVYSLEGSTETLISGGSVVTIDNAKKDPLFILRFKDSYQNSLKRPTDGVFSATLKVPEGAKELYTFEVKPWGDDAVLLRIQDNDYKLFQSELRNDKANLTIVSSSKSVKSLNMKISFKTILKGVGQDDDDYSNDDPDPDHSTINPLSLTITAGDWTDLKVELRTNDDKLYNHPDTFGWYENLANSFKMVTTDNFPLVAGVTNGKQKGTYILHFTCYKAYPEGVLVTVSYADPKNLKTFIPISKKFRLTVNPGPVNYVIMDESTVKNAVVGQISTLSMKPYDKFGNVIKKVAVNALNIQLVSSNKAEKAIIPKLSQNSDGDVLVTSSATKPGTITVTSIKFRDANRKTVASYSFDVVLGAFDPLKSLSTVDQVTLTAGGKVKWIVYPKDSYNNALLCSDSELASLTASRIAPNVLQAVALKEKVQISTDKDYYYWDVQLTQAGTHEFKAFYNGVLIISTKNKVEVAANTPDFLKTTLALFNSKTNQYDEYDGVKFNQNIAVYPEYLVMVYDSYNNRLTSLPTSWKLSLFLTNYELLSSGIYFCYDAKMNKFKMCPDNKLQPNLVAPMKRWGDLVVPRDYTLQLINSQDKVEFVVGLSGNSDDSDGSNLPIDVQNTLISPLLVQAEANKTAEFQITIMTTDKTKRRNEWFDDVSKHISLAFSQDNGKVSYSFSNGEKKGIYKCTLFSTKAYIINPNLIQVSVNNILVQNKKVEYFVLPGSPYKYLPYDATKKVVLSTVAKGSMDNVYSQAFVAQDYWSNQINLNLDSKGINSELVDPDNTVITHMREFPLDSDAIIISFDPQEPGNYQLKFNENSQYTIVIEQGEINVPKSLGNVAPNAIRAGESVAVTISLRDKNGNDLVLSQDFVKKYKFQYFFSLPNDNVYNEGTSVLSIKNNKVTFLQKLTVKGVHKFKVAVNSQPIDMSQSRVDVSPADPSLPKSILLYLDDDTNRYLVADPDVPIKENNVKYEPFYSLILADQYGNEINEFPSDLQKSFTVILYGNDYAIDNPLRFLSNETQGNSLIIKINPDDKERYKAGLFETTPYTLAVYRKDTKDTLNYKVSLLGSGDSDNDAEIEKPIDISQTYLDKNSLKIEAGNSENFMIEIRTKSGKRKADVGNVPIELSFEGAGNYTYQVSPGDLKGRFIVRVSGTKSNEKTSPVPITIKVNKTLVVPKKVQLTIVPAALDHIESGSDLSVVGSADNDYKFTLIPYDAYNNVANVKVVDMNVDVKFPPNGVKSYTSFIDTATGYAYFTVKCRTAGTYTISSQQYMEKSLKFTVLAGAVSEKFTTVSVNPTKILAGESTFIDVYPADAYNNPISPLGERQGECTAKISLKYMQDKLLSNSDLAPNSDNNTLFKALQLKKSGMVTILVSVNQKAVACDSCLVEVLTNAASLPRTKFYLLQNDGTYKETTHPTSPYGASDINLMARLFDAYDNPLTSIKSNEMFKMTMRGNNMKTLDLVVEKAENEQNSLLIDVNDEDKEYFKTLVVRKDYKLTLFYLVDTVTKDTSDILLDIVGDEDDSGNGDIDITKTVITPANITLIAGEQGNILVELRTNENKRFNGNLALSNLIAKETDNSKGTQKLTLSWNFADKNGRFSLALKSFEALYGTDYKYVQIIADGQTYEKLIVVDIDPNVPDPSKTEVIQELPFNVRGGQPFDIIVRLFDTYNNVYGKSNWVDKIQGRTTSGRARFNPTKFDSSNNAYIIPIIPLYPPRIMEVQLVMINNAGIEYTILNIPWLSQVVNDLDVSKTEIRGANLLGVSLGSDFVFYVLLKDTEGYCYEATRKITVVLSGPYINNDLSSKTPVTGQALRKYSADGVPKNAEIEKTDIQSNGTDCLKYYQVNYYGNQIQAVGYYLIEVYLDSGDSPVLSYKKTYMSPGEAYPSNSLLSFISPNLESLDAKLTVYTEILLRLTLRDSFKNSLTTTNGSTVEVQLNGFVSPKDFTADLSAGAGFYDVKLVVKKLGLMPAGSFKINEEVVTWKLMDQANMPSSITFVPGSCSSKVPNVDAKDILANNSLVGLKSSFKVVCLDEFGNQASQGGDKFSAQVISIGDIKVAQSINIPVSVNDLQDGSYRFEFTPTYPGLYKAIIQLNSKPYGSVFFFEITSGLCDANKPYYCINSNKCVASYLECGYSSLSCPTTAKPFKCSVTDENYKTSTTCVSTQEECDCPDVFGQVKCNSDKKCVDVTLVDNMCSFSGQYPDYIQCSDEYPIKCSDGSCRVNENECPSQPGCPPEFRLCPDLTCVEKSKNCPDRDPICPDDRFYRCDDFTCVANSEDCPTRITCPKVGQIVCPDGSCVDSELYCKAPRSCEKDSVLCSDGSCMPTYNDCSKGVTCPSGQALCVDGVCRKQCTTISAKKNPRVMRLLRLLENGTNNTDSNSDSSCLANQTYCKTTKLCVDQGSLCPTTPYCKANEVSCSDFSCGSSKKECKNRVCPPNTYACWDKTCVSDQSLCPSRIFCPSKFPVLCSDGECVSSSEKCRGNIPCPAYRPIRCGTGECKKSYEECPTQTVCPKKNPIRCQDGSCVKDKTFCEEIVEKSQCSEGYIRCGDGSCSVSYSLCPTMVSCAPGQVRCWNKVCADDLNSCDPAGDSMCASDSIQCPDGSCANQLTDCPTGLICPIERPIRCDDGNCRESLSDCLRYTECPENYKRCPDGTCQKYGCSSIAVTCPSSTPYKCYDNTCRKNPFDCPLMPECPADEPILCAEGNCVSSRIECTTAEPCPLNEPVRCPDGLCYSSVSLCPEIDGCPKHKKMCDDGSCIPLTEICPQNHECPISAPVRCPNGLCTVNETFCDNNLTACPFDHPNRCKDGRCVQDLSQCPKEVNCSNDLTLCPDGTCRKKESCPLQNGCSEKYPLKCASGSCVDPEKQSCPLAKCPKNLPFKCPNGLCMSKWNACPSIHVPNEHNPCLNNPFNRILACADGSCVSTYDECRPTFSCSKGFVRCLDGSCVSKGGVCSLAPNSCPSGLEYRCDNGACVNSSQNCLNSEGCPLKAPLKCGHYGVCATTHEECEEIAANHTLPNNCTLKNPFKCSNGDCVAHHSDCLSSLKCNGSYECIDGTCQKNKTLCPKTCPAGQILCNSTKRCANSTEDCSLANGCPANKPKKCSDGSCKKPFEKCKVNVVCPLFKPYLCADLECVGDASQCSVIPQCPSSKPYRCADLSCAKNETECNKEVICPPTNAIHCPQGECVDDVDECKNSLFIEKCSSEDKPFLCKNQECVSSPNLCVSQQDRNGHAHRILVEESVIIDQGCDSSNPKLCSDGSCRSSYSDCDLINGCYEPGANYRCLSGQCAASKDECTDDKTIGECVNNTHRCEDGICRVNCPEFNGCPLSNPIQCFTGFCVKDSAECRSENGKAVCVDNSLGDCARPIRTYPAEKITVTVSKYMSLAISFVSNEKTNTKYASLVIPAGAFNHNSSTEDYPYDILQISPVASSSIANTTNSFLNEKIMKYLFKESSMFVPEQFIRSAVFSLKLNPSSNNNSNAFYASPLNLTITIDPLEGLSSNSYCLGYLVTGSDQWSCEDNGNGVSDLSEKNKLSYSIRRDGVYSVILSLKTQSYIQGGIKENIYCDWWCENGGAVIGAIVGVLIGGLVFGIFFFGFTKYANKQNQGIKEELIGHNKEDAKEEGKKRIEEANMNLQQKNKILEETNNEKAMVLEQNESLNKQLDNLKKELEALKQD